MCGILMYHKKGGFSRENVGQGLRALELARHRGSDGEGVVLIDSKTGKSQSLRTADTPNDIACDLNTPDQLEEGSFDILLGHRRLSIFDTSSTGHQPMWDEFGNCIVFNGEVYNFWEIRNDLKARGHHFKSGTDTEVILKAYKEFGAECLNMFNGMWAMVIWDAEKRQLFIANDRFGVKPLFRYFKGDETVWCSEIKQIKAFHSFEQQIDQKNTQLYLDYGIVGHDNSTMYAEVEKFPSGHYQVLDLKSQSWLDETCFFSVHNIKKQKLSMQDAVEEFRTLFKSAVSLRTRSDVQWGVGLSGGLDSSAVLHEATMCMRESDKAFRPHSFSAVFPGMEGDESAFATQMGNSLNAQMHSVNPYDEFTVEDFQKHLYHLELPPRTASFYAQWKVAELVRKKGVTVLLVGQGADELFGGYHAHFYRYCRQLILSGQFGRYFQSVRAYAEIKNRPVREVHQIAVNELKSVVKAKFGLANYDHPILKKWNEINGLREFMKAELTSFQLPNFLFADDRSSMAFGVETRHPFLDYRVVEFAYSLPEEFYINGGWTKFLVREAMNELPDAVRWRKDKKGFTIPQADINARLLGKSKVTDKEFRAFCHESIFKS